MNRESAAVFPLPLTRLLETAAEAIRPDPYIAVSEWADRYRILDSKSARPGQWETAYAPHTKEPMDRLSRQDPCRELVLMWSSQSAKSEVLNCALGCHIHTSPRPMMFVEPTISVVEDYGKTRLSPMFDLSPPLAARVAPAKSRDSGNTLTLKHFPGGFLRLSGANSAASLASTPIGDLYLDEVDRYPEQAVGGAGEKGAEGDPVRLARTRVSTYEQLGIEKVAMASTPTEKDLSRIEKAFGQTDHNEWWTPCPHCGEEQVFKWRLGEEYGERRGEYRVSWPGGKPEEAVYACEVNGCVIAEHERQSAIRKGHWIPKYPDKSRGGRLRGYHFSALSSPFVSLGMVAAQWDEAQGDPALLKVFVNTRLAETWDNALSGTAKAEGLLARREPYVVAPRHVLVVTASVDVQADRLEVHFVGWGPGEESWALDHVVLTGEPSVGALIWLACEQHLQRRFTTDDGRTLRVAACAVDTGGVDGGDAAVQFCVGRHDARIWGVFGSPTAKQIWPKKPSKTKRAKTLPIYRLGVDQAKTDLYARLKRTTDGPGRMHFPEVWPSGHPCDEEYFRQLTAEKRVYKGRQLRWVKRSDNARNEVLDLWVYAYAALRGLQHLGLRLPLRRLEDTSSLPAGDELTGAAAASSPAVSPPPAATPLPPVKRRPPPRRSKPSTWDRPSRSVW